MKLGTKLLLAPLLTAVALFAAAQANGWLMARAVDALQSRFDRSTAEIQAVTDVQHQLGLVHSGVYRTLGIIGSMGDDKIKAYRADLAKQLTGLKTEVTTLSGGSDASPTSGAVLAQASAQIDKYANRHDHWEHIHKLTEDQHIEGNVFPVNK